MRDYGIYIQPINDPTVPNGTECLQIARSLVHSAADIDRLIGGFGALWTQCGLARMPLVTQQAGASCRARRGAPHLGA